MTTASLLCLACSSSPPPKSGSSAPFTTPCCLRPICERCLTRNPRLRGYNPCLVCLAGAAVVDRSRDRNMNSKIHVPGPSGQSEEQESSMFILGDSDGEEDTQITAAPDTQTPPTYSEGSKTPITVADDVTLVSETASEVTLDAEGCNSARYYIQRGDTLLGISLKYGVDGRTICQLNSLPLSTLSTTPNLLHTRTYLVLPPTCRPLPSPPDPQVLQARTRERAEKRFQFVTKEVDWRVAKAYVALAEDEDETAKSEKYPEATKDARNRLLEARAVDRYLDDEEWEAMQSGAPRIEGFPPFTRRTPDPPPRRTFLGKLVTL